MGRSSVCKFKTETLSDPVSSADGHLLLVFTHDREDELSPSSYKDTSLITVHHSHNSAKGPTSQFHHIRDSTFELGVGGTNIQFLTIYSKYLHYVIRVLKLVNCSPPTTHPIFHFQHLTRHLYQDVLRTFWTKSKIGIIINNNT